MRRKKNNSSGIHTTLVHMNQINKYIYMYIEYAFYIYTYIHIYMRYPVDIWNIWVCIHEYINLHGTAVVSDAAAISIYIFVWVLSSAHAEKKRKRGDRKCMFVFHFILNSNILARERREKERGTSRRERINKIAKRLVRLPFIHFFRHLSGYSKAASMEQYSFE